MRYLVLFFALAGCGSIADVPDASPDAGPEPIREVSTTGDHVCFIDGGGTLRCFGNNASGQLGRGTVGGPSDVPVVVRGDLRWRAVGAGIVATCAVTEEHSLWCWGGKGTMNVLSLANGGDDQPNPTRVGADTDWEDVSVGYAAVCGRHTSGKLECFLPRGPIVPEGGPAVREVSVSFYEIAALDALGQSYLADPEAPTPSLSYAPDAPRFAHIHQPVFGVQGLDAQSRVLRWTRSLGIEQSQPGTTFVEVDGSYDVVAVASDGAIWLHTDHHTATPSPLDLRRLDTVGTGWSHVRQNATGTTCGVQRGRLACFRVRSTGEVGPVEVVPTP